MKKAPKRAQEPNKYQHLITQLLTLFFSGTYISSHDMLSIASKLDFEMPSKNRELILKNLFLHCDENDKLEKLYDEFIFLLQQRVQAYTALSQNYPHIKEVSILWIQKATTIIRLLQQQKRSNPYE
jgi:hypothetical protein